MLLVAVAAVLVVLVVAAAMHLRLGQRTGGTSPEPLLERTAEPLDAASPAGTRPPGPEAVLPDSGITWSSTCGVELPVSAGYGPHARDGQRGYGFARQPAGAVIAALHLVVQVSPQTGPDVFLPTLAEQVTGPDAATFTHEVHTGYEQAAHATQMPYGQPLCPIYGRFAGFLLDSHTDDASSLRLLVEAPGADGVAQLVSVLVQLVWVDGDWRLVAPPRGDWSTVSTLLPASAADRYTALAPEG
jgi:hypothetical protein